MCKKEKYQIKISEILHSFISDNIANKGAITETHMKNYYNGNVTMNSSTETKSSFDKTKMIVQNINNVIALFNLCIYFIMNLEL